MATLVPMHPAAKPPNCRALSSPPARAQHRVAGLRLVFTCVCELSRPDPFPPCPVLLCSPLSLLLTWLQGPMSGSESLKSHPEAQTLCSHWRLAAGDALPIVGALHALSWNEPCIMIAHLVCNAVTDLARPAAHQLPARRELRDPAADAGTARVSGNLPRDAPSAGWFACSLYEATSAAF